MIDRIVRFYKPMSECAICWNLVPNQLMKTTADCNHKFCGECIQKSCMSLGPRCPMCRRVMCGICPVPKTETRFGKRSSFVFELSLSNDHPAGVTLCNKTFNNLDHVIVSRLKRGDAFSKVLKVNDCIESINGIPIRCHKEAVDVIEAIKTRYHTTILKIHRPSHHRSCENVIRRWIASRKFKVTTRTPAESSSPASQASPQEITDTNPSEYTEMSS